MRQDGPAPSCRFPGVNAQAWTTGLLGIAIGIAIGWGIKPSEERGIVSSSGEGAMAGKTSPRPDPARAGDDDPSLAARASDRRTGARVVTDLDDMDPEMLRQIEEAQAKQAEVIKRGLRSKLEHRIARIVEELGLTDAQAQALKTHVETTLESFDGGMLEGMDGPPDPEKIGALAALLKGEGLAEVLGAALSGDQRQGLEGVLERERRNNIEARALKDLSKLQRTLDLEPGQRDQVYAVLMDDAEEWLGRQSDTDLVMREMMSGMGMEMDFGDMDMSMVFGQDTDTTDPAEMMRRMRDAQEQQLEARVERLRPVLDEPQLERYRESLESQGGLFQMMIDETEEGPTGRGEDQ